MPERESMTERTPRTPSGNEGGELPDPMDQLERQVVFSTAPLTEEPVVGSAEPAGILPDLPPVLGAGSTSLGSPGGSIRVGDRVMRGLTTGAGAFVVVLIGLVALFLLVKAIPSIVDDKSNFLFSR